MKSKTLALFVFSLSLCYFNQLNAQVSTEKSTADNAELIEIYRNDQLDRKSDNIDWGVVLERDELREARVYELLNSGKVRTSKDHYNAAMVFQHGKDSIAYGMAVKLMRKAIELDSTINKWLLAAAIDRDLLSRNKPQIYGTQFKRMADDPWKRGEMDTTKITDAERREYGVETLAEQREKVKQMNRKKLSSLVADGKNVDDILKFIANEDKNNSAYDISERGINSFGYQYMKEGTRKEALKIFKLNTELYPNGFNTYDSYGECLLELGQKEKAVEAYKKSLELNPKNTHAREVIEQYGG